MSDTIPDTVTEAVARLRDEGYTVDYELIEGHLSSGDDCALCAIDSAVVERLYRFEGNSDPGDEMIVFGLYDPINDRRGTLADGYGPSAEPDRADRLRGLAARF